MAEPPLQTDLEKFTTSGKISQEKKVKDDTTTLPHKIHSSNTKIVANQPTNIQERKIRPMRQWKKQIQIPRIHYEDQAELDLFHLKTNQEKKVKDDTTSFPYKIHPSQTGNAIKPPKYLQERKHLGAFFF